MYIREAHAIDSAWPMPAPGAPVEEPRTLEERLATANVCWRALDLDPLPGVVDEPSDAVGEAYEAWPDRLYLIDRDGRIAFRGGPGPFGFDPDALEAAIRAETTTGP